MIPLPPGCRADDVDRLADWAEATVLIEEQFLSRDDMIRVFEMSSLVSSSDESFAADFDEAGAMDDEPAGDILERLAEDVLAECRQRASAYSDSYPVEVGPDLLSTSPGREFDAYAFLLVSDLGNAYPQLKDAITPNTRSGRLFEKVVEASLRGLFGRAQRFGWPREPGWPTDINGRIATLAAELGLHPDNLEAKTDPADNDRTLDVVGMMRVLNSTEGSLAILTQCAAGRNWKDKKGEPSVAAWSNLLIWNATIVRAVALPWRLGGRAGDWSYGRAWQMFDAALILDRPRLLSGKPDHHLSPMVRKEVRAWWKAASTLLPRT